MKKLAAATLLLVALALSAWTHGSSTGSVPTITSVSPNTGAAAGGTSIAVVGTGFSSVSCPTGVSFVTNPGNVSTQASACTVNSGTSLSVTSPAGSAGLNDIVVTNSVGSSNKNILDEFTYTGAAPTVTSFVPNRGGLSGGTIVTITGTGFTGVTGINFGSTAATSVSCPNSTSCTAASPAGTGSQNIAVVSAAGTGTSSGTFAYADMVAVYQAGVLASGAAATESRVSIPYWVLNDDPLPGTGGGNCSSSLASYSATGGAGGVPACATVLLGNGFWIDADCYPNQISQGPQILALVSATGSFTQDTTLNGVCNTPQLSYPTGSNFDVTNALIDATFTINTAGATITPAELAIATGDQTNTQGIFARQQSSGSWIKTTWSGASGASRSLGTHTDSTTTNCGSGPCQYLIVGNDTDGPYTLTFDGVAANTFTQPASSESWGASPSCKVTASCTNKAADWSGQTFYSGVALTVTASGTTVTVSWPSNLALASTPTGTLTVTGFTTGTGGSGASNADVSGATFTATNGHTLTYTATGTVVCGTGAGCGISPGNFTPVFSQSPCSLVVQCGNNFRVTGQADCPTATGGTVKQAFLVVQMELWERTDGNTPSWARANVVPLPYAGISSASGLRGLTCVPYSPYTSGYALLATTEGGGGCVWRFDPAGVAAPACEVSLQGSAWSSGYGINAYNNMVQVNGKTLFGEGDSYTVPSGHPYMSQHQTNDSIDATSGIWVRQQSGSGSPSYSLFPQDSGGGAGQYLTQLTTQAQTVQSRASGAGTTTAPAYFFSKSCAGSSGAPGLCSMMVSTRTLVVSPFPTDGSQYVYYCGFDGNDTPETGGTAWCDGVPTSTIGGVWP